MEPFGYLVALLRHRDEVAEVPADWMPWNYKETPDPRRAETDPSG